MLEYCTALLCYNGLITKNRSIFYWILDISVAILLLSSKVTSATRKGKVKQITNGACVLFVTLLCQTGVFNNSRQERHICTYCMAMRVFKTTFDIKIFQTRSYFYSHLSEVSNYSTNPNHIIIKRYT